MSVPADNKPKEDSNRLQSDLSHLREWLNKQPHLHARKDDKFLRTFLLGCKNSLERAKEKIDAYYSMRAALPEFLSNWDPMAPEVQEVLKLGVTLPLGLDGEGRWVFLLRLGKYDPGQVKLADIYKGCLMLLEVVMDESPESVAAGSVSFVDLEGITLGHVTQYTPSFVKQLMTVIQEGYPLRPKSIDYINMPTSFQAVLNLVKSVLKKKIRERIHIHQDLKSVQEFIPKNLLPREYGGDAGPINEVIDQWRKKTEARREFFLGNQQYRADESKRPGKPKTHSDLFGMEGAFRQLSVD